MSFQPTLAALGGALIGTGAGLFMLFARRIAGCSGGMKAVAVGPREPPRVAFALGLMSAGGVMARLLPGLFEAPTAGFASLLAGGLATGVGTYCSNGCTSGHGLCGLSRFSPRSLVAVATFMGTAFGVVWLGRDAAAPLAMVPFAAAPDETLQLVTKVAAGLAGALAPVALFGASVARDAYVGLWCGVTFGIGLAVGGMVRPSAVTGAFKLEAWDPTLWLLFTTALLVTLAWYRVAVAAGVVEAQRMVGGAIDKQLVGGAALFGLGWGLTGVCPGPVLVNVAAIPTVGLETHGVMAVCLGTVAGMLGADSVSKMRANLLVAK